ncbi:dihydrofolate reductase [Parachaetomium inaequale]|uniref:Dihydrofolate reductase n=1 Tax=Parachaetomium inaequale TaxID=2588326 RepID=A0AAN6PQ51_9PEZI|nr:dihydrofolate reductase [Parachaetomium inaequale]
MPPLPDLTLIVAATQQMGIGRNGTLPWTGLRKEMAYFARVTKRLPRASLPPSTTSTNSNPGSTVGGQLQNAVIMGRKTWESIPERFRPLPGRVNVVISRSASSSPSASSTTPAGGEGGDDGKGVVMAGSLEEALRYLGDKREGEQGVGRVFVIGGAQIYRAALGLREARRVLLTRVRSEFECDTFFPVKLDERDGETGWRQSGQAEMDAWVGEEVPRGVQAEAGTEYEFEMWERVD